jgi:hypothetical protein
LATTFIASASTSGCGSGCACSSNSDVGASGECGSSSATASSGCGCTSAASAEAEGAFEYSQHQADVLADLAADGEDEEDEEDQAREEEEETPAHSEPIVDLEDMGAMMKAASGATPTAAPTPTLGPDGKPIKIKTRLLKRGPKPPKRPQPKKPQQQPSLAAATAAAAAVGDDGEEEEDDGSSPSGTVAALREMVTPEIRASLTKQGYRILGSHSGVKLCRWTKVPPPLHNTRTA